ncbi:MAG: chromosomal replication initiator protein DnaA [Lachnospiraceae bacterium]|nr:chromosomal replication initiator protein DnaA [Lachnospiraceae bacterium]
MSNLKSIISDNWEKIKFTVYNEYELSKVAYETFIEPLIFHDINEETNEIIISSPDDQAQVIKVITSKYALFFKVTITELIGVDCNVVFILEKDKESGQSAKATNIIRNVNYENANLNSKYLFETFVVGSNNRFAHSAALAVAELPGQVYNPFYIYSSSGMGKTHLIHAIGHSILNNNPNSKVLYTTSEDFTNEVIAAIRSGNATKMVEFREKYRTVDVLLLDDVQFIIGKESTQEEFFHTFNSLHMDNKQIILTSDKPPKDLETLEERLRSRFSWGLIADMQAPDYETRMAILQRNAEQQNKIINNEIFDYIAKNVTSNVRELESAFNKVLAFSKIENKQLNMKGVEETLKDIIYEEKREITPTLIINIVAEHYNVDPAEITSKRKNQEFVQPRHVVMYLCRKLTDYPYKQIAKILGKKDHSTVIHGYDKIKNDILTNEELKNKIDIIIKVINPN